MKIEISAWFCSLNIDPSTILLGFSWTLAKDSRIPITVKYLKRSRCLDEGPLGSLHLLILGVINNGMGTPMRWGGRRDSIWLWDPEPDFLAQPQGWELEETSLFTGLIEAAAVTCEIVIVCGSFYEPLKVLVLVIHRPWIPPWVSRMEELLFLILYSLHSSSLCFSGNSQSRVNLEPQHVRAGTCQKNRRTFILILEVRNPRLGKVQWLTQVHM